MQVEKYTHGHDAAVLRSHAARTVANSAAYLLPELNEDQQLLDVGCGPGTITIDLANHVSHVTGIDAGASIVAQARQLATNYEVSNVDFNIADVYDLPFADGTFNVVHAHQVLQHLSDPVTALRQLRRVCVPGGIVAARDADYAAMSWYPHSQELSDWQRLYRTIATANGGQPDAGRRMLSWANEAGFAEVTAHASTWCFASPADRQWWSGMWAERIVDSQIARDAVDGGFASRADLERISHGWRQWGAETAGWFAIIHGEVLCRR